MENNKPETQLEQEALEIRAAMKIEVVDQTSYDFAVEILTRAKTKLDYAIDFFKPMKEKAFAAHKEICDKERAIIEPIKSGMSIVKGAVIRFDQEQERIRREAQRQLEIEAHQRMEAERAKAAEQLTAAGFDQEQIEAAVEATVVRSIAVAQPTYEKNGGATLRDNWKAELERPGGLLKLVKFIAQKKENHHWISLIQENQPALNAQARSSKTTLRLPGVRFYNDRGVAVKRG